MRNTYILIFFIFIAIKVYGTPQAPDIIIHKGTALRLFATPLNSYPNEDIAQFKTLFGDSAVPKMGLGCIRGYIATWEIDRHGYLYLTKISDGTNTNVNLQKLFPEEYENGKVKASWVSGILLAGKGKVLLNVHKTYESVYEKDVEFSIEQGNVKTVTEFDNSKTKNAKYPNNSNELRKFMNENINHCVLPDSIEKVRVYVSIDSVGNNNRIEKVKVIRGFNYECDQEAVRVVKSIPEWELIYRKGKPKVRGWTLPITFESKKCTNR